MAATPEAIDRAKEIVAYYTLAATGTGAVPVPATSAVIVVENGAMFAHIAAALGAEVTLSNVVESLGIAGTLNIAGRAVFLEGAKMLSWGTGSVWALAGLCALGATTAGAQTYALGRLAIEIAKNGGKPISSSAAAKLIDDAKSTFNDFVGKRPVIPS